MKKQHVCLTLLAVVVGFALTGLLSWQLYSVETDAILSEFEKDVSDRAITLDREARINAEALYTLKGLFNNGVVPSSSQFQRLATEVLSRHPDIQALEWVPQVPDAHRQQYESERQQEIPEFEFTERQQQGHMIRAGKRDYYFPVYFVEPLNGNEAASGFDLASNPKRRSTLLESADTGQFLITEGITLVQQQGSHKGFLAFLPIYRGVPASVERRREQLLGFVLGVFQVQSIFNRSALSSQFLGIDMWLKDEQSGELLHFHPARTGERAGDPVQLTVPLATFGGRQWTLEAAPTPHYFQARRSLLPYLVFTVGALFVSFVVVYLLLMIRRAAIVEVQVQERTRQLSELNRQLEHQSRTDALTGIANRRYFDEILQREWLRARRTSGAITLIIVDIDHFKAYNDHYGHVRGDECLKKIAHLLTTAVGRPGDLVARYGGEEFALILPDTSERAVTVADKIRAIVLEERLEHCEEIGGFVSVSVGISTIHPRAGIDSAELVEQADMALYRAKDSGRNCTVQFNDYVISALPTNP